MSRTETHNKLLHALFPPDKYKSNTPALYERLKSSKGCGLTIVNLIHADFKRYEMTDINK